uniref:(northern house mosquito) hypothetical protein n=1 Tax=Culex pipiens TaxID=7175 RepID=A0A8D8LBX2_CULPI
MHIRDTYQTSHTHTYAHTIVQNKQPLEFPSPSIRLQSSAKFGGPHFSSLEKLEKISNLLPLCIFSLRDGSFKTEKRATLGRTSLYSVCIQIHYTDIHLSKKGDKKDSDRNNFSFA